eukprot:TRINITY_DN4708_c0_g1_i2.p1 TRINITY_DN4708_c0_g1~~TRINITY_DN4708_c0_g1_i2.p1  ORF type:complete len:497 (+),score=70.05 TRINITY_DN4708_c0_g1_i2:27-1493(+)
MANDYDCYPKLQLEAIVQEFIQHKPEIEQWVKTFSADLTETLQQGGEEFKLEFLSCRIKDEESFRQKICYRKPFKYKTLSDVPDSIGVRVIVRHDDHVTDAAAAVEQHMINTNAEVLHDEHENYHEITIKNFEKFGYRSAHRCFKVGVEGMQNLLGIEIQIRSLMMHAWATMSHELFYKGPDLGVMAKREASKIAAIMETAGTAMQDLKRRSEAYANADPQDFELIQKEEDQQAFEKTFEQVASKMRSILRPMLEGRESAGFEEDSDRDDQSSDGDNQSSNGDDQSSDGDDQSSNGDDQSSDGDDQSSDYQRVDEGTALSETNEYILRGFKKLIDNATGWSYARGVHALIAASHDSFYKEIFRAIDWTFQNEDREEVQHSEDNLSAYVLVAHFFEPCNRAPSQPRAKRSKSLSSPAARFRCHKKYFSEELFAWLPTDQRKSIHRRGMYCYFQRESDDGASDDDSEGESESQEWAGSEDEDGDEATPDE